MAGVIMKAQSFGVWIEKYLVKKAPFEVDIRSCVGFIQVKMRDGFVI